MFTLTWWIFSWSVWASISSFLSFFFFFFLEIWLKFWEPVSATERAYFRSDLALILVNNDDLCSSTLPSWLLSLGQYNQTHSRCSLRQLPTSDFFSKEEYFKCLNTQCKFVSHKDSETWVWQLQAFLELMSGYLLKSKRKKVLILFGSYWSFRINCVNGRKGHNS